MSELQRTTRYCKVDENNENKKYWYCRDFSLLRHLKGTIDGQESVQDKNTVGVIESLLSMRCEQIK